MHRSNAIVLEGEFTRGSIKKNCGRFLIRSALQNEKEKDGNRPAFFTCNGNDTERIGRITLRTTPGVQTSIFLDRRIQVITSFDDLLETPSDSTPKFADRQMTYHPTELAVFYGYTDVRSQRICYSGTLSATTNYDPLAWRVESSTDADSMKVNGGEEEARVHDGKLMLMLWKRLHQASGDVVPHLPPHTRSHPKVAFDLLWDILDDFKLSVSPPRRSGSVRLVASDTHLQDLGSMK